MDDVSSRTAAQESAAADIEAFAQELGSVEGDRSVQLLVANPLSSCVLAYGAFCATRAGEEMRAALPLPSSVKMMLISTSCSPPPTSKAIERVDAPWTRSETRSCSPPPIVSASAGSATSANSRKGRSVSRT